MFTEPLGCRREAHALPHRTANDWANQMKWLIDEQYPNAEKIILVMDNLNTHNISSFYKAFSAEEAIRLSQRLEIHYTPEHGSWLDIAEIELSALSIQSSASSTAEGEAYSARRQVRRGLCLIDFSS